ncbi:class I SAM-dependent methyltransferase [Ancylobacter mangrovi]|uniref:class I SAM-dependent methyltransferase n=1 Tax=Ancylobacter mangrovi TaxID=2972472 RepID=UPI002162FED2|nr:class I SAM-dependent methyltransferase [Ancylobacter mangrovi]MCS0501309.1 class I SAM-dependent methyltransferase [Ancylobacter mangrovi]
MDNASAPVRVLEKCSDTNFFEHGYIQMNPDIKSYVENGGDAEGHFRQYGVNEVRFQFTREFSEYMESDALSHKYDRYKKLLGLGDAGHVYLRNELSFPVSVSEDHYKLSDYLAESANDSFPPFLKDIEDNPDGIFMDLGCGLRKEVYPNCIYVEVYPSTTADIVVGTECRYPFPDNTFDAIGCFSVLEHTKNPWSVAREIHRMLKPGGRCYIDWPFLAPVHGYPSHYFNATREGLKLAFGDGFEIDDCRSWHSQGPDYSINWILNSLVKQLPPEERDFVSGLSIGELMSAQPQGNLWKRILGSLPESVIEELAAGNSLIATKTL